MFTSAQTVERRCGGFRSGNPCLVRYRSRAVLISIWICGNRELMEPSAANGFAALPNDVLIVEDDPIIALDCEDTILGFGVKTVRTAANVARALDMIADRAPDFALLDVGLIHENSFAVAERLDALRIPLVIMTGYGPHFQHPA